MTTEFSGCDGFISCDGKDDCAKPITHDRSVWVTDGHLKIEYFCINCAPEDSEFINFENYD